VNFLTHILRENGGRSAICTFLRAYAEPHEVTAPIFEQPLCPHVVRLYGLLFTLASDGEGDASAAVSKVLSGLTEMNQNDLEFWLGALLISKHIFGDTI